MKILKLTLNKETLVDSDDYEKLSLYSWFTQVNKQSSGNFKYYGRGEVNGKKVMLHRFILNITDRTVQVDHINGNSLDNRKSNLRICTSSQNNQNARKTNKKTKSKYKGVIYSPIRSNGKPRKSPWTARIQKNKERISLGFYKTEEEAARAYDIKAKELFGEFAVLNFSQQEITA